MSAPVSYTITEGTEEDLAKCLENSHAAFEHDTNTLFKMWEQGTDDMKSQMPPEMYGGLFPKKNPPTSAFFKAVDNETGEVIGHVMWGFWNFNNEHPEGSRPVPPSIEEPFTEHPDFPADPSLPRWKQMSNISSGHLFTVMDRRSIPGKPAMYCRGITVHPKAQARGIGSALVKKSCEIADEHHASMWCHLSNAPGVVKAFQNSGFRVNAPLTLDLDEYASKPMPEGREKWGSYTWSGMTREAR